MLRRHTSTFASVLSLVSTAYLFGEEPAQAPPPRPAPVTTTSTPPPGTSVNQPGSVVGQPGSVWVQQPGRGLSHRRTTCWVVPPSQPSSVADQRLQPVPNSGVPVTATHSAGGLGVVGPQRAGSPSPFYYLVEEPRPGLLGRLFGLRRTVAYYGQPPWVVTAQPAIQPTEPKPSQPSQRLPDPSGK